MSPECHDANLPEGNNKNSSHIKMSEIAMLQEFIVWLCGSWRSTHIRKM